jgi:hypothetical protein
LVERLLWEQEVTRSNRVTPTTLKYNKKNIEKNLTSLSDADTIVVKDKRLSNSCFRKWFPFGNVLVPATVLFSGGEFINLALCVRILDNHLSILINPNEKIL